MPAETEIEIDAQYRQLREECGLVERANRAVLLVAGADAAEYLQGQLTNDVEALGSGDGTYAALLDRKGHMQADMRVLRPSEEPKLWLELEAAVLPAVLRHLTMYSIGREVTVEDVSGPHAIISLIGPRSVELAGTAALPENACEETNVAGVSCIAFGTGQGLDLIHAAANSERLRAALIEAGAVAASSQAAEILRIEAGVPRYGAEMGAETMPAEAGIVERAVSFTKGCYIGQETVARLHYKGKPNRHLRGLKLSAPAPAGAALRLGEKEVGTLGSVAVSPALGPIGLAIVRREAEPGTELRVGEDGVTAEVVSPALRLNSAAMGRGRARFAASCAVVAALALAAAGCGAETHPNDPRPQVATRVSVTVNDKRVIVDPQGIGMGPEKSQQIPQNQNHAQPRIDTDKPLDVVFVAANQTGTDSELEVTGPTNASSGPLLANSPATFQADLPAGTYVITAADIPTARPAQLVVGDFRASSENDVLLP